MGNQYSHECPMITAAPLQENLFEWHINMCATNGILQNTIIHLIATFPPNYPKQPPTIRVCSFFPHPNVFHANYWQYDARGKWKRCRDKNNYYLCLDMLKRKGYTYKWIKDFDKYKPGKLIEVYDPDQYEIDVDRQCINDAYHGWSAAHSVTSILLQLSSFLFEEKAQFKTMKGAKGMREESQKFKCTKCGHKYSTPYPPLTAFNCHKISKSKKRHKQRQENKKKQKEEALQYIMKQIEGRQDTEELNDR